MKAIKSIVIAICAVLLVTSCGLSNNLTSNANLNQTNVVLAKNNFKVVKSVEAETVQTYIFGIGGINKKALKANAIADLTKNAGLTGSQALVNITVKESVSTILGIYTKYIINAEGTVVEFTE